MKRKGIYLVKPDQSELKFIYNIHDIAKAGGTSKILKVNNKNIKFGQSNDFEKRYEEFCEIFGNVKFIEVLEIQDSTKLMEFKKNLKKLFEPYCLKSLKDGRSMDWLKNIDIDEAHRLILKEYSLFNEK